jgi:glycosyltransferase involved in cell wall biosynthesis
MEKEERKKGPLITTIIPTYRRPQLLKRAILSVLNQTYSNFQVCIYDNASGDETAEIVKELAKKDPRVKYYCHPENIGGGKNLNFGLSKVDTSYFSILSDDDILLPDFYEKALNGFQRYPEAGFIATQTLIAKEEKILNISYGDYEEKLYRPPEGLLKISNFGLTTWTGVLFKKEVRDKIGLLDEQVGGPSDFDFLLRITSVFPYVVLKSPGAIFFVHQLSKSSSWSEIEPLNGYIKTLEKIKNNRSILAPIRLVVYQNIKKRIAHVLWQGGLKDIKKRNFFQAKRLAKSLKNDFDENLKSVILYYSARFCEFSSIFYYSFLGLNQIRKFMNIKRRAKEKKLQNVYGTYLKYLDKYSG